MSDANSILQSVGNLDVVNATLRAPKVVATTSIGVANTSVTETFSVADKFHVDKDSTDPVSITGNVVASGIKISNLTIGPAFDFASVSNVGNVTANVIQFANATTGFTTTANVEIGGNITLTANAQVKVGSNVLAEYTGPHPREPTTPLLKKFPEIAFDASKLDGNGTTNTYTQAGYTVTASSSGWEVNGFAPWKAFNENNGKSADNAWHTYGNPATVSGSPYNTIDSNYVGEWIKLELPTAIKLSHVSIVPRYGYASRQPPSKYRVYGSNNNSTWVQLIDADNVVYGEEVFTTRFSTTTNYYKYLALVIQKGTIDTGVTIGEIQYYGYEEPAPVGDLSLDTTLKSTFNSVRSNNYVMYFDGKDPAGDPVVPKYLPSGTVKTITPNNITFDATNNCWSLDGSTESNVTTADLGFEGDVPHTVSMWVNSSNLDANATTQQLFTIGSGYDKSFLKVDDTQIAANTWHNVTYAYQGEGGSKVTYVDGRKVEEVQVEDTFVNYPHLGLQGYETGGYRVSVSEAWQEAAYRPFSAFNDGGTDINNIWHSPPNYTGTSSEYVGGVRLAANVDLGHWIKLETPYKIQVSYVNLVARPPVTNPGDLETQAPKDFQVCGSNDDVNWDVLASFTGEAPQDDGTSNYIVNAQRGYKYLALAVNKAVNSTSVTIANIKYYGHKEGDLTRFPDPTNVLKYPHLNFTGHGTAPTNGYHAAARRGYIVSASTKYSSTHPTDAWRAFDGVVDLTSGSGGQSWDSQINSYAGPHDGALTGRASTGTTTFNSRNGEWINVKFPHKVLLTSYQHWTRMDRDHEGPYSGYLYGSNDGFSTFQEIHRFEAITLPTTSGGVKYLHTVSSSYTPSGGSAVTLIPYNEYRLQVTHTQASTYLNIALLEFYGTEEDTGTPAIVGGPFAGKVANFRVYDKYLGDERIQEIYDAQKDEFGHKKSSMTFYKGRIGVGTTEPEGALTVLDEPHALAKFPARAVSADDSYVEGGGQIKLSAADGSGYQAFDGLTSTSWVAKPERKTRLSEEVDLGAWLKIQTPESMSLKKAEIESNPYWEQIGSDINGSQTQTFLGLSVDCTHDGTRIIAGAYQTSSSPVGEVRVYDWNGTTWVQVGNTITGPQSTPTQGFFGHEVAISGNGQIIAVGADLEDPDLDTDKGTVRVLYLNGSTWTILPDSGSETVNIGTGTAAFRNDIFVGAANSDQLGEIVKLSYDGRTILMTAPNYDDSGAGTDAGQARVYTYSNGAWSKKGDFLVGSADDHLGYSADMSEDGNCIILGGHNGTDDNAWIYIWNGTTWVNRGASGTNPAFTRTDQDAFGQSVAINNDGTVVAFGLVNGDIADGAVSDNGGIVQVYHWSGTAWVLKGTLRNKDGTDDEFGSSVHISGDGKRIIVGAKDDSTTSANNGRLYTFEYDGYNWVKREPFISIGVSSSTNDDTEIGNNPKVVTISRDGSVIVSGEFGFNSTNGSDSGRVRVLSMPSNIKGIWGSNDDKNWTKITTAPTREEATSNVAGLAFGYDDRLEIKNLDNPNYYKYHAIVADAFTRLKDVKLFGVRKQGSSTLHDGTLTLTKNLDVPRIGPAFDVDDTPRRDRLVVEYNTSTNPVEDGVVRDTSGRGLDSRFHGTTYYDVTEKSIKLPGAGSDYTSVKLPSYVKGEWIHSVSVWVNASALSGENPVWCIGREFGKGGAQSTVSALALSNAVGREVMWDFYSNDAHSSFVIIPNVWYHIVVVYIGGEANAASQFLYINGVKQSFDTGHNINWSSGSKTLNIEDGATLLIGALPWTDNDFYGSISNFKLYDCALTAEEVKTLYDIGRRGHTLNPQILHIETPLQVDKTLRLPIDNTNAGTYTTGMIRYNPTFHKLQMYNGTQWITVGGVSASGGNVTYADGYAIHTFNSSGTFTVNSGGEVEYLIIAGGGGGGWNHGGGGGAGGVITGNTNVTPGAYTVTRGGGGAGGTSSSGNNGANSTAFSLSAIGGGGGGRGYDSNGANGNSGGSGGGGGPFHTGGSGYTGQGNDGGNGISYSIAGHGGGGGGAGGPGGNGLSSGNNDTGISGRGGIGLESSITGTSVTRAGGGSGGRWGGNNNNPDNNGNVGGVNGGGGLGGASLETGEHGANGTANTGGGGGGGGEGGGHGGTGGSGIIIIRYLT